MGAVQAEVKVMADGGVEAARRREDDPPLFYEAHVFVCCNRRPDGHRRGSCAAKGSEGLRDYMKARAKELGLRGVRVNMAGCLDRCEFGPSVVIYPEGVWYRIETKSDVDAILAEHLVAGGRVRRLMLTERDVPPPKEAAAG
ncbi:(2Fe-2S) ferredoxin domain-containing protein [Elioraea tepida]